MRHTEKLVPGPPHEKNYPLSYNYIIKKRSHLAELPSSLEKDTPYLTTYTENNGHTLKKFESISQSIRDDLESLKVFDETTS